MTQGQVDLKVVTGRLEIVAACVRGGGTRRRRGLARCRPLQAASRNLAGAASNRVLWSVVQK